jgi:hypothetical protein
MTILTRRSRSITFRVSAEEFDALSAACINTGARSISEFARVAVLEKARYSADSGTLSGDLTTLSITLGSLDNSLVDVSKRIRSVLGGVAARRRERTVGNPTSSQVD